MIMMVIIINSSQWNECPIQKIEFYYHRILQIIKSTNHVIDCVSERLKRDERKNLASGDIFSFS